MTRRWSFFSLVSGEFTGQQFCSHDAGDLAGNTPSGCGAKEGDHDRFTRKVDLHTGAVIEWDNVEARERAARMEERAFARARIAELEARLPRATREHVLRPGELGDDGKLPRERLQEIDDEIATLREVLRETA